MIPTPVQSGLRRDVHEHVTARCKTCGKPPIRQDVTFWRGNKAFAFVCPSCPAYKVEAWPSKREAAEVWNEANQ